MKLQQTNDHPILSMLFAVAIGLALTSCSGQSANDEGKAAKDGQTAKEQSEGSKTSQQQDDLTIEEFADAAEQYIRKKTEEQGGYFKVKDEKQGKTLKLTLDKVHRKRLSHLGDNKYFVCADFKGQDGNLYDIDIFMKGTNKDNLEPTEKPMVHKVNGNERFTWYEEDGIWKRRMKDKKNGSEHPDGGDHEHPNEEHPSNEHPNEEHPN
jgi:hypothetical protein